ncbi:MAG: ECF-type sigma factor [Verrucomicrobiia bacterium]
MNQRNQLLESFHLEDPRAAEELLPLVYTELRNLAAHRLARERPGQTLQPTALVHEAYLRLIQGGDQGWKGRHHFFAAAAEAMRRILVENARRKQCQKRGGKLERVDWAELSLATDAEDEQLLVLNEALAKLEQQNKPAADLVKLRFFVGMNGREAAEALGLAERSATRLWAYARAWLLAEVRSG